MTKLAAVFLKTVRSMVGILAISVTLFSSSLLHAAPVLFHAATTDSNAQLNAHKHIAPVTIEIGPASGSQSTAFDNALAVYNAVPGSSLSMSRGSALPTACTSATVEALLTLPGFSIHFCDPDAFTQIGLQSSVLGATQTKTDAAGAFTQGAVLIRNNLVGSYILAVVLHELGHLVGLDHSRNYSNNQAAQGNSVMFPLVILPADEFSDDDLGGIYTNYASTPGTPSSLFGGINSPGACIHGSILTDEGTSVNGVVVTLHNDGAAAVADKAKVSTISGTGYNSSGSLNGPGEYTLCAPFDEITHITAQLCPSDTTVTGLKLSCGDDGTAGESPGMMPNFILPYDPTGANFIYESGLAPGVISPTFAGDFTAGTALTPSSGQFQTGVDIIIDATIVSTTQTSSLGDSYTVEMGGCQAGQDSNSMDLSLLALLLLPLFALGIERQRLKKVRVRSVRRVPSR